MLGAVLALAALLPGMGRPAAGQAAPPERRVVRIPLPKDDGSLTPYSFQLGYPLLTLVYDTLLWRDPSGVPQPWLASGVEISANATRFTVRLDPKARWHDGRPLTAEDVRFTFRHVATHPSPRFSAEVTQVDKVTVADPATVVITTKRPSPGFADQTLADLPILPAHLWQALPEGQATPAGLPVGSGPYRLTERLPDGGYRFVANPDYHRGKPTVDEIVVPIIGDIGGTLAALTRRNVDMVPLRLPPDDLRRVEGLTTKVARGSGYLGVQLVFNVRRPPFDDAAVRRSVSQAIDLKRLATTVGDVEPAEQGLLHPESRFAPGRALKVTDEVAARAALAPLGQRGSAIEILTADNDPVQLETARQVALALERAGVPARSQPRPVAEVNRLLGFDGATPDFSLAVSLLPATASYDPDFLARLFGSGTVTTSGYTSSTFDAAALKVATTTDPAARKVAAAEELALLATDLPALPLLFPNGAYAYYPAAHDGWRYVRGIGILDKQSFLPAGEQPAEGPTATSTTTPPEAPAAPAAVPRRVTGKGFPFIVVPAGMVAAAVVLMGLALYRRRG